ncbi:MAG: BACON domain-containing protein [Alistipes sp.]|nr:BACON domain-containing protein [Alistipes sp.]
MKKIFYLMLAVAALGFVACNDDDVQPSSLEVVRSDIGFEATGGDGTIDLTTMGPDCYFEGNHILKATTNKDWITINATTETTVNYTVAPYTGSLNRSGKIFITAGTMQQEVTILQNATTFDIEVREIEVDPSGQVATKITYETTSTSAPKIVIPEEASWITATMVDGGVEVRGDLNYTAPRTGTITIQMDWKPVEITVAQGTVNLISMEAIESVKASATEYTITPTEYLPMATAQWDVTTTDDWIYVEKTVENTILVKLEENGTGKTRTGTILLTDGGTTVLRTITVEQGFIGFPFFNGEWSMPCYGYNASGSAADIVADVAFEYDSQYDAYYFVAGGLYMEASYVETEDDAFMVVESQYLGKAGSYYLFVTLNSDNGYAISSLAPGYGIKFVYKDSNTVEIQEYNNPGWPDGGKTNGIVIGAYANSSPSSSTKLGNWDMFRDLTTMTRK